MKQRKPHLVVETVGSSDGVEFLRQSQVGFMCERFNCSETRQTS